MENVRGEVGTVGPHHGSEFGIDGNLSDSQSVRCELHVSEVLVELLEHVQHDRRVGRITAKQELPATIVTAFASLETSEMVHGALDRTGDERLELDVRRDPVELRIPVAITRLAERDMAKPELRHLAAVDDECGDGVGLRSERPLVELRFAEPTRDFEHLAERVPQVRLGGRRAEFHADKVSKEWTDFP